jgi:hypothetical protein
MSQAFQTLQNANVILTGIQNLYKMIDDASEEELSSSEKTTLLNNNFKILEDSLNGIINENIVKLGAYKDKPQVQQLLGDLSKNKGDLQSIKQNIISQGSAREFKIAFLTNNMNQNNVNDFVSKLVALPRESTDDKQQFFNFANKFGFLCINIIRLRNNNQLIQSHPGFKNPNYTESSNDNLIVDEYNNFTIVFDKFLKSLFSIQENNKYNPLLRLIFADAWNNGTLLIGGGPYDDFDDDFVSPPQTTSKPPQIDVFDEYSPQTSSYNTNVSIPSPVQVNVPIDPNDIPKNLETLVNNLLAKQEILKEKLDVRLKKTVVTIGETNAASRPEEEATLEVQIKIWEREEYKPVVNIVREIKDFLDPIKLGETASLIIVKKDALNLKIEDGSLNKAAEILLKFIDIINRYSDEKDNNKIRPKTGDDKYIKQILQNIILYL